MKDMNGKENNLEILKRYWGYDGFRSAQEEIIESIESGRDTLALMPTGGGKSICFQVPAMASEGVCLVVSPLIALMKDQVQNLRKRKIPALSVHSGMTRSAIDTALDNAIYGDYKFLYVSPERLSTEIFKVRVAKMKINYLVIDEAHCISQWGYDFRPAYLKIKEIKEIIGEDVPTVALTATATKEVAEDIMDQLSFRERNVIATDFSRNNLTYLVKQTDDKYGSLLRVCKRGNSIGGSAADSGIVYCRERKKCAEIAQFLSSQGVSADFYHAGLGRETRSQRQDDWIKSKTRVIVATNAFGMGIDKPDVRFVVHYDVPDSIEAYFQEAGRAGRDGEKSSAIMLWNTSDVRRLRQIHNVSFPKPEYIAEVYQDVFNFFKIAYGEGAGLTKKFDLQEFTTTYKLNAVSAYYALKYLDQEGYWELTDEIDNPARIMFEVGRDELYHIQLKSSIIDTFVKSLLRMYTGLFSKLTVIDEEWIAKITLDTKENVAAKLKELASQRIIKYIPQIRTPLVFFKYERLTENNFCIDMERYNRRKEVYQRRIEGIIGYIEEDDACRSRYLIDYFSQPVKEDCGRCDVCVHRLYNTDSQGYDRKIANTVLKFIRSASSAESGAPRKVTLQDILSLAGVAKEKLYIKVLRALLDEGRVVMNNDETLRLN